jgi:hypothetical protein
VDFSKFDIDDDDDEAESARRCSRRSTVLLSKPPTDNDADGSSSPTTSLRTSVNRMSVGPSESSDGAAAQTRNSGRGRVAPPPTDSCVSSTDAAWIVQLHETLRGHKPSAFDDAAPVGSVSPRRSSVVGMGGRLGASSDSARRALGVFKDAEHASESDVAACDARATAAACVDEMLRGHFPGAHAILLDPRFRTLAIAALADCHPAVSNAVESAARRSLPYATIPRDVLSAVESASLLSAVADAVKLPCDSETYGGLQSRAEKEQETAARLVIGRNIMTLLCDTIRKCTSGGYTGHETLALSRPGSPTGVRGRPSASELEKRVLALWRGLEEAVGLCLRVGTSRQAFAEEISNSRIVGVICHAVCDMGNVKHRAVRESAAQILRALTTDNGLVPELMHRSARDAVSDIIAGYSKVWAYLVGPLDDTHAPVAWNAGVAIEALLTDDTASPQEGMGHRTRGEVHAVTIANAGSRSGFAKAVAGAFSVASGDTAGPAARVAISHVRVFANSRPSAVDAESVRDLHRAAARAACGRITELFTDAFGPEGAPPRRPSGRSAARRCASDSHSRLNLPPARVSRALDSPAVASLCQYLKAGLESSLLRASFAQVIVDSGVATALQAQLDAINEASHSVRARQMTRGNVLYGVVYNTLHALFAAQKDAAEEEAAKKLADSKSPVRRASSLFSFLSPKKS